jgi:NAD(P)-dependent dehydrogenase (short-subunit alcohol dehydrogenase family)
MLSLKDKTVLIIGRGSGIAHAMALAVGEDGGRVIVASRHAPMHAFYDRYAESGPAARRRARHDHDRCAQ